MQDIHSSIHIPIKHKAAVRAVVHPLGQRFVVNAAATGAGLAGVGRVHELDCLASVFSFVRQAVNKLAPRCIVDRLGKHSASQALHIQILQHDAVVLRDKPLAGGLDEFLTLTRNTPVNFLNRCFRGLPSATSFLASGKAAIGLAKLPRIVFGELRQGQRFAFAGGDETGQSQVNADDRIWHHGQNVIALELERNEPFAIAAADRSGLDLRAIRQLAVPAPPSMSGADSTTAPAIVDGFLMAAAIVGMKPLASATSLFAATRSGV